MIIFSLAGKKSNKREPDDLKKEVELDVHSVPLTELAARYGTDLETGLTTKQARAANMKFGLNQLTPPAKTPKWVKFMKNLFTGFSLLLWAGDLLCFIAFGVQISKDSELEFTCNGFLVSLNNWCLHICI